MLYPAFNSSIPIPEPSCRKFNNHARDPISVPRCCATLEASAHRSQADNDSTSQSYTAIMPKLWDIPYELMNEIIFELKDDKLALCQLGRAASWLNSLVRPVLFRHLKVKFPYPSQSTNRTAEDIIRVYEASLDLQHVVQSLSLRLETSAPITPALVTATWMISQEANKFLEKFPLLRSLEIHSTGSSCSFWPGFLETNAMKHLTKLELHDICLDPTHLLAYMMIENINHISVSSMRVVKPGALVYSPTFIPRTSPLRSLDLGSAFPIAEELLEWLLQWPRGLETLVCNVPGEKDEYLQHFGVYSYGYRETLVTSPRAIARSLASMKHSLLNLEIRSEASHKSYDQTRLDMSDFEVLQTLILPCRLLFESPIAHQSRDGMFQLLPRSLLELEVNFSSFLLMDCFCTMLTTWPRSISTTRKGSYL